VVTTPTIGSTIPDGTAVAGRPRHHHRVDWPHRPSHRLRILPDGALLATTGDDRTVRLWNVADGTAHSVLTGHTSWVERLAFSPDGTLLATSGNDGTVRLWQIPSGTYHCALRLAGPVAGVAWHPGGTILCTVGGAGVYLLNYQP
jgi:WD40 repeat protein